MTLIETSIALDAFVFVVNKENPVKSLTVNQIQQIYTKEITNWSQVGGNNADMKVFTRPRNSGLNCNSMAYKLYEWLQSKNVKYTITECGFLPK